MAPLYLSDSVRTAMSNDHAKRVLAILHAIGQADAAQLSYMTGLRLESVRDALERLSVEGRVERLVGTEPEQWTLKVGPLKDGG